MPELAVAVLEVVCILVGCEKQRMQLQHVGRAVGQGESKASLAQELVLLELVPQVLHTHQLQVRVVLGKRQCIDARALSGLCSALYCGELGLIARLLLRQASCCVLLPHGHLEALPYPLPQQLPLLLAVCALAHPGCGVPSA
eukprot:5312524-Pleurochrysis_carterae.AAC.4